MRICQLFSQLPLHSVVIVAITGKNDEMIHAFDIQTGERIWQLKPKFEDYHRDSADKPKSGMAGHRAVLHSDVAFMDHDVHSEKDKRHQVDVLWLAGGETLIRIDGVTGDIIWRWDSDLG